MSSLSPTYVAVVCMDGFDYVERVKLIDSSLNGKDPKRSKEIRFCRYLQEAWTPFKCFEITDQGFASKHIRRGD